MVKDYTLDWEKFLRAAGLDGRTFSGAELERIVATPNLSKDVFEQVSKSLS